MDPVTTAILAAIAGGLVKGASETVPAAVRDAYIGLRDSIKRRFGADSSVEAAISDLENKPDSTARRAVVEEEIKASGAASDSELVTAAEQLLELISAIPGGEGHVQKAVGNYIAQADRSGRAEVRVNQPQEK